MPVTRRRRRGTSGAGRVVRLATTAVCAIAFAVVAGTAPAFLLPAAIVLFVAGFSAAVRARYLVLDAVVVGALVAGVLVVAGRPAWSTPGAALVVAGAAVLGWLLRRDRSRAVTVVGGTAVADAMLADLRHRVRLRSALPSLPPGWDLDVDLRSAHGERFCGDFVVTATDGGAGRPATGTVGPDRSGPDLAEPDRLGPGRVELVLVDVSGAGHVAGARALLLASAFEALLHAAPGPAFLPAANGHVLRQGDDEGFATAVHLSLEPRTGSFVLRGAGHLPAALHRAATGCWEVLDADQGPALGLLPGAGYPAVEGRLEAGDALLLYTDGLVESRRCDVQRGIARLTGHAGALLTAGTGSAGAVVTGTGPAGAVVPGTGDHVATRISRAIRTEAGDDRALVVVRRGS